jgi:translocator protein
LKSWPSYALAFAGAFLTAAVGGALTDIGPWYKALIQPSWKPPDWAFGPIWTVIFIGAALSAAIAWNRCQPAAFATLLQARQFRQRIVIAFVLNAVLNVFWSFLYFYFKQPSWAAFEVVFLWLSIVYLIYIVGRVSRVSAALLFPYLIWVAIAALLNWQTVRLNP